MTKAEIISGIADKTGQDKAEVTQVVETLFTVIKDSMAKGNEISFRGFGNFIIKKKAKKIGRNISKNTAVIIDEHYAPKFKPSAEFIDLIKASKKA